MKSVGFIGKADKTDLVSYVSKIISAMGKKVVMIDATSAQKTRYTIPIMSEMEDQAQYIVQHDGVEIAIGFSNILELKKYLLSKGEDFNDYDYVIVENEVYKKEKDAWKYVFEELDYHSDNGKITLFVKKE